MNPHRLFIALCVTVMVTLSLFGQDTPEHILARVGSDVIGEKEFLERFELTPRRLSGGAGGVESAKEALLFSMIAERLLAQAGREEGVDSDPIYKNEMERIRRLLARDELYREEVQRKVSVSPEEVASHLGDARRTLLVEYLYAASRGPLDSLFTHRRDTISVWQHAYDSRGSVSRDTITVSWGESEASLEAAVFTLKPGQTSEPVPSSRGWFVCRVIGTQMNDEVAALGGAELRSRVESTLRLRKERDRLDEYIRLVMRDEEGAADPVAFRRLTDVIRTVHRNATGTADANALYKSYRDHLGTHSADTLVKVRDGALTIRQVLDRMESSGFQVGEPAYPGLEWKINTQLKTWVWQSILESIAIARGLDTRPDVARLVGMWSTHYLAEASRRKFRASVVVSGLDPFRLLRKTGEESSGPRAQVELMTRPTYSAIAQAIESNERSPIVISHTDLLSLGALGDSIWSAPVSQWSGPVSTDSGVTVGRIIRMDSTGLPRADVLDSLSGIVAGMKLRSIEATATARRAARSGYTVFDDRLRDLQVSTTPMLSYRIVGFGGRMFAVPFVRTRLDWLERLDESGKQLP